MLPISRHRAPSTPRHRAAPRHARPLTTAALAGVTLGGSLLYPLSATASPARDSHPGSARLVAETVHTDHDPGYEDPSDGASTDGDSADGSSTDGDSTDGDSSNRYGDSDDLERADAGSASARPAAATRTVSRRTTARAAAPRTTTRSIGRSAHPARRTRPMSSGELQYRNGCRQGYIVEDCDQFDVPHLLQRGINPYL